MLRIDERIQVMHSDATAQAGNGMRSGRNVQEGGVEYLRSAQAMRESRRTGLLQISQQTITKLMSPSQKT